MADETPELTREQVEEVAAMMQDIAEALLGGLDLPLVVRPIVEKAKDMAVQAAREHPGPALQRLRAMREVLAQHKELLDDAA